MNYVGEWRRDHVTPVSLTAAAPPGPSPIPSGQCATLITANVLPALFTAPHLGVLSPSLPEVHGLLSSLQMWATQKWNPALY